LLLAGVAGVEQVLLEIQKALVAVVPAAIELLHWQ
jgi:hypothetical protein